MKTLADKMEHIARSQNQFDQDRQEYVYVRRYF